MAKQNRIDLAEALADLWLVLERKCKRLDVHNPWGDRSTPATQLVGGNEGTVFYVYEAGYRECIYPRVAWRIDGLGRCMGEDGAHALAARMCLKAERAKANKDRILAVEDRRPAMSVPYVGRRFEDHTSPIVKFGEEAPRPHARAASLLVRASYEFGRGNDAEAVKLRDEAWALVPRG